MSENSETFLKLIRSDYAEWLMGKHPWAYLLLNLIALRACRSLSNPKGLKIGEALIGDWHAIGATRGQYRHALLILQSEQIIEIIETNRTRKKKNTGKNISTTKEQPLNTHFTTTGTTTGTTTEGTKVKILNSVIWDINPIESNHWNNHWRNHRHIKSQPNNNHEEEYKKDISKDISHKEEALRDGAHPASPIRSKDSLNFDFEKYEFIGITEKNIADWKLMYPHIDIKIEMLKASQWLKNNPSKSNKKQWGKFLTGWFGRSNDAIENKKAYRFAAGGNTQDRRTKDINGNPVNSPHTGRF